MKINDFFAPASFTATPTPPTEEQEAIAKWESSVEIPCEAPEYKITDINDYVGIGIDFETGGLNPRENAITQIALVAYRLKDLAVTEKLSMMVYPYKVKQTKKTSLKKKAEGDDDDLDQLTETDIEEQYTERALEYSDITMEQLYNDGIHVKEVAEKSLAFIIRNILKKSKAHRPFFIGHNIQFDLGFWQQLMNVTGYDKMETKIMSGNKDYYGNFQAHYIDSIDIARAIYAGDKDIDKYKLENLAERMGFPMYDAHDALADTDACTNIYLASAQSLRNTIGSGNSSSGSVIITQEKDRVNFKI